MMPSKMYFILSDASFLVCLCVTKMKTFNDRIQRKGVYRRVEKTKKEKEHGRKEMQITRERETRRKRVTRKKYPGMWHYNNPCVNNEWLMFLSHLSNHKRVRNEEANYCCWQYISLIAIYHRNNTIQTIVHGTSYKHTHTHSHVWCNIMNTTYK